MSKAPGRSVIFVIPRKSSAWKGAEAIWITVGGWAMAVQEVLGEAVVLTSDKVATPAEVLHYPFAPENSSNSVRRKKFIFIPGFLKLLLSDMLLFLEKRSKKAFKDELLSQKKIAFVWEQHDLFGGPGYHLSRRLGVPFILYVHAPVVWEASRWGVKRRLWGRLLETFEKKSLKRADAVLVVSQEVKLQVQQMGIPQEKILVSPMAVDPQLFKISSESRASIRSRLSLENKFVVGWTGSFRKFHGLDILIKSFANFSVRNSEAILLLVGDGSLRREMEDLAVDLDIADRIIFAGKVDFSEIPLWISAFDLAVVGAPPGEGFHYSPLKLREYLAGGKAVLAPGIGEIPHEFGADELRFYKAGDVLSLSAEMEFLFKNPEERERLGLNGRHLVESKKTWQKEVEKTLRFLNIEL